MARAVSERILEFGGDVEEAGFGTEEGLVGEDAVAEGVMVPTTFCWAMLINGKAGTVDADLADERVLADSGSSFYSNSVQNRQLRWKLVAIGLRPSLLAMGV